MTARALDGSATQGQVRPRPPPHPPTSLDKSVVLANIGSTGGLPLDQPLKAKQTHNVGAGQCWPMASRAIHAESFETARRTFALIFLQCGMWRSPASALNLRPQWGHGMKLGSGADGCGGGRSARLLPLFWASVTTLACQRQ